MNSDVIKNNHLTSVVKQALDEGILKITPKSEESTPISTTILIFVGALFSSGLLFATIALFISFFNFEPTPVCYLFGALFTVGGMIGLRRKEKVGLFLENFLFILLIVGIGLFFAALVESISMLNGWFIAIGITAVITLICTILVPTNWMRQIGGFSTAILFFMFFVEARYFSGMSTILYEYIEILCLPLSALLLILTQSRLEQKGKWREALLLKLITAGWLIALFLVLRYSATGAILLGTLTGEAEENFSIMLMLSKLLKSPLVWIQILSLPAIAWWVMQRNSLYKSKEIIAFIAAVTIFSLIVPSLSLCMAFVLLMLSTQRYKTALLGALCALTLIAQLYYNLNVPLITKSVWFAITGCVLLGIAWIGFKSKHETKDTKEDQVKAVALFNTRTKINLTLLGIVAAVTLIGVNLNIMKQEQIRTQGVEVLIPLAPIDPRSLMQGDYMVLNFRLPTQSLIADNGIIYLSIDDSGVAELLTEQESNEIPFKLVSKGDGWRIGADAWFFKEGDGARWEAARYGVFKVDRFGDASLVGLADSDGLAIK